MNEINFKEMANQLGVVLTNEMISKFEIYYNYLIEYNKQVNLTAITDKKDVYVKHFIDSIVTAKTIKQNATICDIGAGAGFPSIPLKIVRPDIKLVMVDSLNKRIVFLNQLIDKLGLKNARAIHSRAEDFAKIYRESFDYSIARAVAKLNILSEYCIPFVKIGGYFLPYKSGDIEQELNSAKKAIKTLGGEIQEVLETTLPDTDIKRSIIVIKKVNNTPKKYPRSGNKPKTQPL